MRNPEWSGYWNAFCRGVRQGFGLPVPVTPVDYSPEAQLVRLGEKLEKEGKASMSADDFWTAIAEQIEELTHANSADDVLRILSPERNPFNDPSMISGEAFFAGGSAAHPNVMDALLEAGWRVIWCETDYHYAMEAPDGSAITYIEGDIYSGNVS